MLIMDNIVVAVVVALTVSVAGGIITLLFFKNKQRLLSQSLHYTSRKQVGFGNMSAPSLTIGSAFGQTLALPFLFFDLEVFRNELVTPEFIAGVVFVIMLSCSFLLSRSVLRCNSIRIITDDTLVIGKSMGLGKIEKYPIKELLRKESMASYSMEKPTVTLHISVYHENSLVCTVCPEFDGKKKKELLLELLRQIPEKGN